MVDFRLRVVTSLAACACPVKQQLPRDEDLIKENTCFRPADSKPKTVKRNSNLHVLEA